MQRKESLTNGEVYHVMNKSIAGYRIFHSDAEYSRMIQMVRFFSYRHTLPKFSRFLASPIVQELGFEAALQDNMQEHDKLVQIIAYCFMPTHIHFLVLQKKKDGISNVMGNILNAYARYFNVKRKRQGPLWVGRFKNVHVSSDEQLLHLTRYVHLNPVTAGLIDDARDWKYSSYAEYITPQKVLHPLCDFRGLIDISPAQYRRFVNDHAGFQRDLARIKKLIIE